MLVYTLLQIVSYYDLSVLSTVTMFCNNVLKQCFCILEPYHCSVGPTLCQ